MYDQVKKSKDKSRSITTSVTQKKSNLKRGFGFVDNRPKTIVQRMLQKNSNSSDGIIQNHSKQCGCASCTTTLQPQQENNITTGQTVLQLAPCPECKKNKGHLSGCSRHKHNRSSSGKGTHKLGGSHDDGSGYQRSGSGGDRHEKGRRAAQKARDRKK